MPNFKLFDTRINWGRVGKVSESEKFNHRHSWWKFEFPLRCSVSKSKPVKRR